MILLSSHNALSSLALLTKRRRIKDLNPFTAIFSLGFSALFSWLCFCFFSIFFGHLVECIYCHVIYKYTYIAFNHTSKICLVYSTTDKMQTQTLQVSSTKWTTNTRKAVGAICIIRCLFGYFLCISPRCICLGDLCWYKWHLTTFGDLSISVNESVQSSARKEKESYTSIL